MIDKRTEDEKKEEEELAKEEEIKFKPGQYEISEEISLKLENLSLRLEIIERDKKELEDARHFIIGQAAKELGVPDDMKIVGGTADFKKLMVEKKEN